MINQEEIIIVNSSNFIKQTLLDIKAQIDPNIVAVGYFKTPQSLQIGHLDQKERKKRKGGREGGREGGRKEVSSELNDIINHMNLRDIYGVFHLTEAQYTFFSAPHGTFSKTDT
jgi:hypothetical protein